MNTIKILITFLCLFLQQSTSFADVTLPAIISNNMVIQQNTNLPIWGWADPGEKVNIKASWLSPDVSVSADENGDWFVKLKSPLAGGPHTITITGKNEIILQNVLAGEVWFASGQSNMAMSLKSCENAKEEIEKAKYPEIRLFHIERTFANEPQIDCKGKWVECTPQTAKDFSGVAYFFGRKIHTQLNVPIGLISASKGGSPAEAWMAKEKLRSDPELSAIFDMWKKWENEYSNAEQDYNRKYDDWQKKKEHASALGKQVPKRPSMPEAMDMIKKAHRRPGALYNAMVAPVIPYAIKGVIWYQGSNNLDRPIQYRKLFPSLIKSWRSYWGQDEFPFYYVQNTPYRFRLNQSNASLLREAQYMAVSVPNTGMVVTTDIGDLDDNHPKNKKDVGKRLALWALAKMYGYCNLVYSGPIYKSMKIEGNKIRLFFDHVGSGLMKKGETLTHFKIAGSDKKFVDATAVIDGSTVVVHSAQVLRPVNVRFGWNIISSVPNLFNKEGLPAAPFRTDKWSLFQ